MYVRTGIILTVHNSSQKKKEIMTLSTCGTALEFFRNDSSITVHCSDSLLSSVWSVEPTSHHVVKDRFKHIYATHIQIFR